MSFSIVFNIHVFASSWKNSSEFRLSSTKKYLEHQAIILRNTEFFNLMEVYLKTKQIECYELPNTNSSQNNRKFVACGKDLKFKQYGAELERVSFFWIGTHYSKLRISGPSSVSPCFFSSHIFIYFPTLMSFW